MTAIIRRCSTFGLGATFFFTASLALAQAGGAAGEGSGGAAGDSAGGEGGDPSPTPGTRLGRACQADLDCQDSNTPDLQCVTETQTVLGNGAPPRGLCTSPCDTDDDCAALSVGAVCFPFEENTGAGYCVEGCSFGEPAIGDVKCHGRDDFACNPAFLADTGVPCATGCLPDELCIEGTCAVVFPACTPSCRGDLDCAEGMYCDQSFLSGVCVPQKPAGKTLGEACTVTAEPDECLGFCQADVAGGSQGHCATTCGLGTQCSWNASSERFDGACFFASVITAETGSFGDFGFCTPSCNCTDECGDPTLECQHVPSIGRLDSDFRGPGLCFSADPQATRIEECADPQGGAGGEPNSSAGNPQGGSASGGTTGGGTTSNPSDGGETHDANNGSLKDSGCGCKLAAQRSGASSALWLLPLVGLLLRRRRTNTIRLGPAR